MTRNVPFVIHTMKVFTISGYLIQQFWSMFQTIVNEKCNNMTNIKLKEDFVLFGKAKDFKSDEIFNFIILFARFFIYKWKWKINAISGISNTTDSKA